METIRKTITKWISNYDKNQDNCLETNPILNNRKCGEKVIIQKKSDTVQASKKKFYSMAFGSYLIVFSVILLSTAPHFVKCQLHSQQYFKSRPQPNIDVIEGGSVVLQCSIGNQRGSVQWAKDGFVLGFDRNIPGFERYSMLGDSNAGVHNLRITNAKSEDNGEYQCQVGPGAGNNQPIRAISKLNVLIPPQSIEIIGHTNVSQVSVKEGQTVTLDCQVIGGKPSAQIKWFRKNVEIRSDNTLTKEMPSNDNELSQNGHQLSFSKSTITIRPHAEDNGIVYTCEAIHTALLSPMRHSLTLSVLYPPGPPEISGYTSGETVRMGDTITLLCKSIGGNPLAQLVWYKNDEQIDFSYTTTSNRQSSNSHTFTVEATDNNAVYRCIASSTITEIPMVSEVKLQVHFAPSKVTITGAKDAKSGDSVTMNCVTERSNPPSEISWVVDGRPITTSNTVVPDPSGGFITSANVTVNITNQDRNMKMLSCYAINQALGETIVETSVLNIFYPPDPPTIFGYEEGSSIRAGTLQRITCVCHGGNPLCQTKWFKGEHEVKHGTQLSTNGNTVSNELAIITKDSDNGAQYRCEANNSATTDPLIATVVLTVHFPPTGVFIKLNPSEPKAGGQVEMLCETGSSNPSSMITWWRDGFQIPGHQDGIIDALYGGKTTRNILKLNVSSDDDNTVITCQATNTELKQSVHDAVTLSIRYLPEFLNSPLTQFDLVEGQSSAINLTARANPSQITYEWKRDSDKKIDPNRVVSEGPVLNFSSIMRSDSGIYKLFASNEMGVSETAVKINVNYPARIVKISELVTTDENGNALLSCSVDSNPSSEQTIVWRRRRNESSLTTEPIDSMRMRSSIESSDVSSVDPNSANSETILKSTLIIYNASLEDSGTGFDCVANNGVGEADIQTAILIVLHKPIIDRSPILSKSASDNGMTGKLICKAVGAPNVTFQWSREGSVLSPSSPMGESDKSSVPKYVIESTNQLDLVTYQSVLVVSDVQTSDYGSYECVARNELGFDAIAIQLNKTSKPEPPLALTVINITSLSVTLKWIPGFDGGLGQEFRVRYKPTAGQDPSFSYRDVFPSNSTQITISGLKDDSEYIFSVMSSNQKGQSLYTPDIVKAKTLKESPVTETEKIISKVLSEHASDIPRLIIIVSLVGSSLLLFNIVLVVCFVRKRRRKRYEEGSDYSNGTESKTTESSKTSIEMYNKGSNSGNYNKGINESSLTSEEDDNKSQTYSGQTDYEMEISPSGVVTTHSHGISTYLIDDAIAPSQHYPNSRYTNLVNGVVIGPDVTTNTYLIDRHNDDYASALRKNAYNQQLTVVGSGQSSPQPSLQHLNQNHINFINSSVDQSFDNHSPHSRSPTMVGSQQYSPSMMSTIVPPLPPLRSIQTNNSLSTFLPAISEEPIITPMGHLV